MTACTSCRKLSRTFRARPCTGAFSTTAYVACDRTSKVAFAELYAQANRMVAADVLRRVLEELAYKVHTVVPGNGVEFTPQPQQVLPGSHSCDRICRAYGGEHRLFKPAHPWSNGQVERFNGTLKEATVQRYHYQSTA